MTILFFNEKKSDVKNIFDKKKSKKKFLSKIIIPKKFVKLAVNRNKIRRQIRAILMANNIKKCCVKYYEKQDKQNFQFLKDKIESLIKNYGKNDFSPNKL